MNSESFNTKYLGPAILSFFVWGLGQLVKGEIGKGLTLLLLDIILSLGAITASFNTLMVIFVLGLPVWVWNVYDAYIHEPFIPREYQKTLRKEIESTGKSKYCTQCGNKLSPEDNFCGGCGAKV